MQQWEVGGGRHGVISGGREQLHTLRDGGSRGASGGRPACLGSGRPWQATAGGSRSVGGQEEDGGRQAAPPQQRHQGPQQVRPSARQLGGKTEDGGREDLVPPHQGISRLHGLTSVRPVQRRDVGVGRPQQLVRSLQVPRTEQQAHLQHLQLGVRQLPRARESEQGGIQHQVEDFNLP